jgi:hypothetical protein
MKWAPVTVALSAKPFSQADRSSVFPIFPAAAKAFRTTSSSHQPEESPARSMLDSGSDTQELPGSTAILLPLML